MTTSRVLVGICALYLLLFAAHAALLNKTVYGDGVYYYSWLRSVIVDRNIDFTNEYAREHVSQPPAPSGLPGNKYSIGPAIAWAPLYVTAHTALRGTGWELPYQVAVGVVSVLSAIAGLVLLTRLLRTSDRIATVTLLAVAGATNLLFYGAVDPVNSHALSFFAAVTFLLFVTEKRRIAFAAGAALAILAMIRLQDIVYLIVLIPYRRKIAPVLFLAGFVTAFLPQLAAWYALYGSLTNPYIAGGESFDLLRPHILGTLFSPGNGLFLWTPVVAAGAVGLLLVPKTKAPARPVRLAYLAVCIAELLVISSWSTWSQGASYSGRMFVSILPLIAIGIASATPVLFPKPVMQNALPYLALSLGVINSMGICYFLLIH